MYRCALTSYGKDRIPRSNIEVADGEQVLVRQYLWRIHYPISVRIVYIITKNRRKLSEMERIYENCYRTDAFAFGEIKSKICARDIDFLLFSKHTVITEQY